VPSSVELPDRDDSIALVEWNVWIEVRVDDGVRTGAEGDGYGQAKPTDDREAGRPGEHSRSELEVER
jgi:hypothetical protein